MKSAKCLSIHQCARQPQQSLFSTFVITFLHFSSIAVIFIRENIHRILNSLMDSQFTEKRKRKREIIRAPVSCFISSSFNMVKNPVIIIKDSIGSTNIIFQLKQKTDSGQKWDCDNVKMESSLIQTGNTNAHLSL